MALQRGGHRLGEREAHSAAVASRQETLEHATRTVRATLADVLDWDADHGVTLRAKDAIAPEALGAIKSIESRERERIEADGARSIKRVVRVGMHSKERPLELLFEHHGLRKPVVPPAPEDELRIRIVLTDETPERRPPPRVVEGRVLTQGNGDGHGNGAEP